MKISTITLETQSLNRAILAKTEGLLTMLNRRGFVKDADAEWVSLLQDSIAFHERCEEELQQIITDAI